GAPEHRGVQAARDARRCRDGAGRGDHRPGGDAMTTLILLAAFVAVAATTAVLLERDLRRAEERARWRRMRGDLARIGRAPQERVVLGAAVMAQGVPIPVRAVPR